MLPLRRLNPDGTQNPSERRQKDPLSLANASVWPGEPDCSPGILKRSIKTTDVTQNRKAAPKRVNRVPAMCAVMPQAIALRVIAPCDKTMISALIRPRAEFGMAR